MSPMSLTPSTYPTLRPGGLGPTLNPHPHLPRMREIARAADVANSTDTVVAAFHPYLESASVEEWQLLFQYGWDHLVGPEEWQLFEACNDVISLATQLQLEQDCSQVRSLQDKAFDRPHSIVHFIMRTIDPGVDRRLLMLEVVKILVLAKMKREKWMAVGKRLQDCQKRLAKRDSLIGETDASSQA